MSESAEALAANEISSRNVTIEITNMTNSFCLLDPKIYLDRGHCHSPPQPTVRPQKVEVCNFTKTSSATGAVGVLTYTMIKRGSKSATEKLAIMFSVPYDRNLYKNWVGIGFYKEDQECNEALYKEMYYEKKPAFTRMEANGCCISHKGEEVEVLCTMSSMGRSIMKVELWEKSVFAPSQYPY